MIDLTCSLSRAERNKNAFLRALPNENLRKVVNILAFLEDGEIYVVKAKHIEKKSKFDVICSLVDLHGESIRNLLEGKSNHEYKEYYNNKYYNKNVLVLLESERDYICLVGK